MQHATYTLSKLNDKLSPACMEDLARHLFTHDIEITATQELPDEGFSGQAELWNLDCTVECLVQPGLVLLCAQPLATGWGFGDCFPQMPGKSQDEDAPFAPAEEVTEVSTGFFLSQLGFQDGLLIYAFAPAEDGETPDFRTERVSKALASMELWKTWSFQDPFRTASTLAPALLDNGLLLAGNLSVAVLESSFGSLLRDLMALPGQWFQSTFPAVATIENRDALPKLKVRVPLLNLVQFGPAKMEDAHIALTSPIYPWPESSRVALDCTIEILETRFRIEADLPLGGDTIIASAALLGEPKFFKSPNPRLLPDLCPNENLKLELAFSISKCQLERISFATIVQDWNVLPKPFEFRELALSVIIFPQREGKPIIIASFLADVLLDKIGLTFGGLYPSGPLTCSLDVDTPLKLRDMGRSFGFAEDFFPDLCISEFGFSYDFQGSGIAGWLRIGDAGDPSQALGDLPPNTLQDLHFWFQGPEPYSAEISATFRLAYVTFKLFAKRSGDGWQFEGSTPESIHIAELMADLAHIFGITSSTPDPISDVTINQLAISFNTGTKNFTFTLETKFPVDGQEFDMVLIVKIERQQDNSYTKHFSGKLTLNGLEFDVIFDSKPDSTILIATYSDPLRHAISVHDLVATVYPGNPLPSSLTFAIKDALLSYQGHAGAMPASKYLFGLALDISAKGSFRQLPLVGPELPETVGIEGLRILVATQQFETSDVTAINGLLPPNVTQLPLGSSEADQARDQGSTDNQTQQQTTEHQPPPALARGITLSASLKFGEESYPLLLAPSSNTSSANGGEEDENQLRKSRSMILSASTGDEGALSAAPKKQDSLRVSPSVKWIKIEKCLGPLYFKRAGLQYQSQNQELGFLLDAVLSAGGLTLSLDGLGCHSPIDTFDPKFELHGLGISFKRDQLEIGGAFLRMSEDEYGGTAIFKTDALSLSAIGLYKSGNDPSMFVYAFLDYPLGGPPFFYVTGLAAGFGYNRLLVMPPIDQVAQYPLIAAVRREKPADGKPVDLSAELQNLCEVVPVQRGQYLLAAGVKFTSFKMIDSFALLAVSFGEHLEIDILGFSIIKVPFSEDEQANCLAEIEIAFKASFIPADGFLGVMAQLTSASYILSKDCHLTGGMAFYSWFSGDHAGDFVLTVGGYHSDFKVPAHYPQIQQVPRLAINWQVSSALSIKGDAYFALTPSALMAGGHLEATWQSGPIKAWFTAGADFLIAWQPFHYDARVYVDMGVRYTFWFFGTRHITVELGADLHIWGPEFSGVAHVHLWCVSFSVSFGAGADQIPAEIGWKDFEASFLPKEILSISVKNGLVSASSPSEAKIINLGVINPKDFSLVVDSVIPVKTVNDRVPTHHEDEPEYRTSFGIAPMNITDLRTSNLKIMLNGIVSNEFTFTPITKNVPAGLWGTKFQPDLNSEQLVENVVCGFEITPAEKPKAAGTAAIDPLKLQDQLPTLRELHVDWEKELLFSTDKSKADQVHDHTRRQAIQESLTKPNTTRQKVLADLGLGNEKITIDPKIADIFIIAPQIEAASM